MKKIKTNSGFTIIESMVVLFIIAVLTGIAAIGFSKANQNKLAEQASRRASIETGRVRNDSFSGLKINDIYPCGYAISFKKGEQSPNELFLSYTSSSDLNRLRTISENLLCDEKIKDQDVLLSNMSVDYSDDLKLGNVYIEEASKFEENVNVNENIDCLTLLFSAPRGGSYYCTSSSNNCPPSQCHFNVFTEINSPKSDYFQLIVSTQRSFTGGISKKLLKIYPSGNVEISEKEDGG